MSIIYSQGSGVADSVFGKSQEPIKAIIEQGVEAFQERSQLGRIFCVNTTKNYAEKYTSETSLGDFEDVGENGAYPITGMMEGYSKVIEPTTWKSKFEVTQEMIEDAKIGKIKSRANIFTTSYNRTREKVGATLFAGGVNASTVIGGKSYDTTSADGVSLFSKVHPSKTGKGAKQSNIFTGAFAVSALDKIQEKMQDFADDDGNILTVAPDTIVIPNDAALKRAVLAAIGSDLDPNTANNALNFQCGLWNVLVWPYLPKTIGAKPYFVMLDSKFREDYECLPWLDRVSLTVKSDIDPNTDANVFKGRARFGAGFNNWRCTAICGEGLAGTALV
ncbi:MAG: hypothetical protein RSD27_10365 [Ruthenibacterium sp.]